jgi:antitoxin component of MazEF toxin-antitoxin module
MGKKVNVKKTGNSLRITLPAHIAEMYEITEGSTLDLEPMGSDSIRVRVMQ